MYYVPDVYAVAIVEGSENILCSTDNWDISEDVKNVNFCWDAREAPFIHMSGVKYTMLECEIDSMVATSIRGEGHIVGVKNEDLRIISYLAPDGDRKAAIVELSRILAEISHKESFMGPDTDFNTPPASEAEKLPVQIDPQLRMDVERFLEWIKDPYGFQNFIDYYLQMNDTQIITKLSKIYLELIEIFNK